MRRLARKLREANAVFRFDAYEDVGIQRQSMRTGGRIRAEKARDRQRALAAHACKSMARCSLNGIRPWKEGRSPSALPVLPERNLGRSARLDNQIEAVLS